MPIGWPTVADLGLLFKQDLTDDAPSAQAALDQAVQAIRDFTRQTIDHVDSDTINLRSPSRGKLILPQLPVTEVTSMTFGTTVQSSTSYDVDLVLGEIILVGTGACWPTPAWRRLVTVVYSHGYVDIPQPLRAVALQVAARIFRNPLGKIDERTDGYRQTLPGVFPLEFSRAEQAIMGHYVSGAGNG